MYIVSLTIAFSFINGALTTTPNAITPSNANKADALLLNSNLAARVKQLADGALLAMSILQRMPSTTTTPLPSSTTSITSSSATTTSGGHCAFDTCDAGLESVLEYYAGGGINAPPVATGSPDSNVFVFDTPMTNVIGTTSIITPLSVYQICPAAPVSNNKATFIVPLCTPQFISINGTSLPSTEMSKFTIPSTNGLCDGISNPFMLTETFKFDNSTDVNLFLANNWKINCATGLISLWNTGLRLCLKDNNYYSDANVTDPYCFNPANSFFASVLVVDKVKYASVAL